MAKQQKRKKPGMEYGSTGRSASTMLQYRIDTDEYLSALTWPSDIPIYEKMGRSDSQVKATLLMLELPIRSTQWFIKPADKSSQAKKNAEFIEQCLFSGYPSGLNNSFDDFLKNISTMFQFGHSVFEKVFEVRNGQFKWKKFAIRPQSTICDFIYDDVGDIKEVQQYLINQAWKIVNIPISKLLVFSHDMKQGDVRGISCLRASYKHWKIKDFLYKTVNIGVERNLVGTPVLDLPEGYTEQDFELAKQIVSKLMSHDLGGVVKPESFLLNMFEGKRTLIDVLPYIEYQDMLISRSILAQFMNLGTKSGSYALSNDQSELFLMMLEAACRNISAIINTHAIPELIEYNFNSDLYPKLTFKPLNSAKLIETLTKLTSGKLLIPDEDLENWLRDMLDLPDKNKETSGDYVQNVQNNNQGNTNNPKDLGNTGSKVNSSNTANGNKKEDDTKNEKNNKASKESIGNKKLHESEDLKNIFLKQINDLKAKILKSPDKISNISVRYKGELTDHLKLIMCNENFTEEQFNLSTSLQANNLSETLRYLVLKEYNLNLNINSIDNEKIIDKLLNNHK